MYRLITLPELFAAAGIILLFVALVFVVPTVIYRTIQRKRLLKRLSAEVEVLKAKEQQEINRSTEGRL